jgi:integrase
MLQLDWVKPLRHMTFYKAVDRPAVLRANRLVPTARLSAELKFHSLRRTYASLCVAAGIPPLELSRFMGHNKVTTTLGIYTHLFEDDHAAAMTAKALWASTRRLRTTVKTSCCCGVRRVGRVSLFRLAFGLRWL